MAMPDSYNRANRTGARSDALTTAPIRRLPRPTLLCLLAAFLLLMGNTVAGVAPFAPQLSLPAAQIAAVAPAFIGQTAAPDAQLLQDAAKALRPDARSRSTKPETLTLAPDAAGLAGSDAAADPSQVARSLTMAEPLHPPRGIVQTSYWQAHKPQIITFIFAVLALAGALIYWQRKRALRPAPVDPREQALQEIADAAEHADAKRFASAVSDAVRTYLEVCCGLRATEQTTEEFLHDVRHGNLLPHSAVAGLKRLLELCDLAKFAQQGLNAALRAELAQSASALVNSLGGNSADAKSESENAKTALAATELAKASTHKS